MGGGPAPADGRDAAGPGRDRLDELDERLATLEAELAAAGARAAPGAEAVDPVHRRSLVNLAQYLALRRHDIRSLQDQLAELGLSSLGRAESHVLASTSQVRVLVDLLRGVPAAPAPAPPVDVRGGARLLAQKTDALFGVPPDGRATRIMVTMPSEAATDPDLVRDLVARGMDCARINTAHDGPEAWARMADNVRRAAAREGRPCSVLVDLAGPKLRTVACRAPVRAVRLRPRRDRLGRVVEPARAWLSATAAAAPDGAVALPVGARFAAALVPGATVRFDDARGERRSLRVAAVSADGALLTGTRNAYLLSGTALTAVLADRLVIDHVGLLPPLEEPVRLARGERFVLCGRPPDGAAPGCSGSGGLPSLCCEAPEAVAALRPGDAVWLDDGRVGGTVRSVLDGGAVVEVRIAPPSGAKVRSGKGIVLPDAELGIAALTESDLAALPFVAGCADIVGMSFVERPGDLLRLRAELTRLGAPHVGVIVKVETARAFARLPELLVAAMAGERVGVMIARGDLAVSCGFERLAEVQEEILWLCEAAHLPVIWATQVLDQLARSGLPSRAEITDAAMGERAECVMLNKGPYIREATTALDDILRRMTEHQTKRRATLRRLAAWRSSALGAAKAVGSGGDGGATGSGTGDGGGAGERRGGGFMSP